MLLIAPTSLISSSVPCSNNKVEDDAWVIELIFALHMGFAGSGCMEIIGSIVNRSTESLP